MATLWTKSTSTTVTQEGYAKFESLASEQAVNEIPRYSIKGSQAEYERANYSCRGPGVAPNRANLSLKLAKTNPVTADKMQHLTEGLDADKLK